MSAANAKQTYLWKDLMVAGAAFVCSVLLGFGLWYFWPPGPRQTLVSSHEFSWPRFSPDGRTILGTRSDPDETTCTVAIWDVQSGRELKRFQSESMRGATIRFIDNNQLSFVDENGLLVVHDIDTGAERNTGLRNLIGAPYLAASRKNDMFAAAGKHQTIGLWSTSKGEASELAPIGENTGVSSICFSADGKSLGVARKIRRDHGTTRPNVSWISLETWDVEKKTLLRRYQTQKVVHVFSTRLSQGHVVAQDGDGKVTFWAPDYAGDQVLRAQAQWQPRTDRGDARTVNCIEFSPDGDRLAVRVARVPDCGSIWVSLSKFFAGRPQQSEDLEVVILDVAAAEEWAVLPGCRWGSFSPDGQLFAAVGADDTLAVWDLPPRKPAWGWFALAAMAPSILVIGIQWFVHRRNKAASRLPT
jgi:WD40 repeat protein